jgi:serine O-acetyltransferase
MGAHVARGRQAVSALAKVRGAWRDMVEAVREDHEMLRHYDERYAADRRDGRSVLVRDLVTRIGFQMLTACRAMRFCVDAEIPLAPRVASRLIRHVYGADIHWEAHFEPGIVVVHGMGLAVSRAARVERGVILFQNVTLGMGTDPTSRLVGAPVVEQGAHVGAGTTLIGPIVVGARSKVTANCLLRASVPPDSLVEAPAPTVSVRPRRGPRPRREAGT